MVRRGTLLVLLVLVVAGAWVVVGRLATRDDAPAGPERPVRVAKTRAEQVRERLYAELQPVRLANCTLERFGEAADGGYLMCGNLLDDVAAGYSYGISNYDGWGCDISRRLGVRVHQYDCFDTREPACPAEGDTLFHAECVAGEAFLDAEGRRFDTVASHVARNGDDARRVVVKMDVEGAEWDSLFQAPDTLLDRIDQITVEFHGIDDDVWKYYRTFVRLRERFHVAHLHFNNFSCREGFGPFPAYAYEVLFVNKRIAVLDPDQSPVPRPHALDAANAPERPDCQYVEDR